jgi:hypothetical protein
MVVFVGASVFEAAATASAFCTEAFKPLGVSV